MAKVTKKSNFLTLDEICTDFDGKELSVEMPFKVAFDMVAKAKEVWETHFKVKQYFIEDVSESGEKIEVPVLPIEWFDKVLGTASQNIYEFSKKATIREVIFQALRNKGLQLSQPELIDSITLFQQLKNKELEVKTKEEKEILLKTISALPLVICQFEVKVYILARLKEITFEGK